MWPVLASEMLACLSEMRVSPGPLSHPLPGPLLPMIWPDHMKLSQQTARSRGLEWNSLSLAKSVCLGHAYTLEGGEVGQVVKKTTTLDPVCLNLTLPPAEWLQASCPSVPKPPLFGARTVIGTLPGAALNGLIYLGMW